MVELGEPHQECGTEMARATPGSTNVDTNPATVQGNQALLLLPSELHVNIMAHLFTDPVSQICFGLTSRYFYQIYHEVRDARLGNQKKMYNIKRHPMDLAMQASICGSYVLHGWTEYWFLEDCDDIQWERTLGSLLAGETWLWRDLSYCQYCRKYKSAEAFRQSACNPGVIDTHGRVLMTLQSDTIVPDLTKCRMCRAKALLIALTGREEVMEFPHPLEESRSLGLKIAADTVTTPDRQTITGIWSEDREDAIARGYELWEDVFARLDFHC